MAASNFIAFDSFKEFMGDGTIDLDADTFKMQLHTSAYTPNRDTQSVKADLSNEVANASGYTTGGVTLASVTWVEAAGTVTFDCSDVVWTASGGTITARYAVILDDTPVSPADPLMFYSLLDTTPADVAATDGNTLTVAIHASGVFTVSGATS